MPYLYQGFSYFFKWNFFLSIVFREAVAQKCSAEKGFLKISQKLQGKTYTRVSFLIKLQVLACNFNQKRDFGAGFFLWFVRNF